MQARKDPKTLKQKKLDAVVITGERAKEFSRDGILEAVAKFVACDDQVSDGRVSIDNTKPAVNSH
jgi:hypothetical protein